MILFEKVNVARNKLQSSQTVDYTQSLSVTNLAQKPILTICPRNGTNEAVLQKAGYTKNEYYILNFLSGNLFISSVGEPVPVFTGSH